MMESQAGLNALVLAYKRPELTNALVREILKINEEFRQIEGFRPISKIFLIHDYPRRSEDAYSLASHNAVKDVCDDLVSQNSIVKYVSYDNNAGLTNHILRVYKDLNLEPQATILFEEDKAPTYQGIEFLGNHKSKVSSSTLLDTLPISNHANLGEQTFNTMFTDNGNLIFGNNLFGLTLELWKVKDKYGEEFDRNLDTYFNSFLTGYSHHRAFHFYRNYWRWGLNSPDRPDALFAYALILSKSLKVCSMTRLSEDWSGKDHRGMNINKTINGRGKLCILESRIIFGKKICQCCERRGASERVSLSYRNTLLNSAKFRINRIFGRSN